MPQAESVQSDRKSLMAVVQSVLAGQSLRWPLVLPLGLAFGAAAYMTLPMEPGWRTLLAAPVVFAVAAYITRNRFVAVSMLCTLCLWFACGALAGKTRTTLVAAPVLAEQIGSVRIEGVVAEIDASDHSRRLRIAVRAIEDLTPQRTPKFVRISYRPAIDFAPGRPVACRAILSPPPRPVVPGDYVFNRDAWFDRLGAVGFAVGRCEPLATPMARNVLERVELWVAAVRRKIAAHVFSASGAAGGGMSAAMLAGDRSYLTPDDSEALRLSGLAHLLSISGLHMALAGGIFFFLIRLLWPLCEPLALRAPAVQVAAAGAIIACTLYFVISGGQVSTQRAYVMALVGFGAKLFDRPALSLRSVAVAMTVVVLLQPEAVVTPGFQMSFAASAALIALYEFWFWPTTDQPEGRGVISRVGGWIAGAAATSITASLAAMPFALHHFNRAAVFSVAANLAISPIISFWTTPAAAAAAVAAPFGLQDVFLGLLGKSLGIVLAIARYSARLSPSLDLPRLGAAALVWASLAIAAFFIFRGRGRSLAAAPAAVAIVLWLSGPQPAAYIATDGSVYARTQTGWVVLKDWRRFNGLDPLLIGDDVGPANCPGKGVACRLALKHGEIEIVPAPTTNDPSRASPAAEEQTKPLAPKPCPSQSVLRFTPSSGRQALAIDPCAYAEAGAVIETGLSGPHIRAGLSQTGRPWGQPVRQR